MNNILPRAMKMHYKYDLKGSSYKRRASRKERAKSSPTFKDLDFKDMHEGLHLDSDTYNALMKTLQRDCRVSSRNQFSDTTDHSVSKFAQASQEDSIYGEYGLSSLVLPSSNDYFI